MSGSSKRALESEDDDFITPNRTAKPRLSPEDSVPPSSNPYSALMQELAIQTDDASNDGSLNLS